MGFGQGAGTLSPIALPCMSRKAGCREKGVAFGMTNAGHAARLR
jgi:hypothetical protein